MHLDDPLGDGEAEAGAALRLGRRIVGLMEFIENPLLLARGDAGPGIAHRNIEEAVRLGSGDGDLALVGEFDGIANEIEEDLSDAPLVAPPGRKPRLDLALQGEMLLGCERLERIE